MTSRGRYRHKDTEIVAERNRPRWPAVTKRLTTAEHRCCKQLALLLVDLEDGLVPVAPSDGPLIIVSEMTSPLR
jgi:hypothetical protein